MRTGLKVTQVWDPYQVDDLYHVHEDHGRYAIVAFPKVSHLVPWFFGGTPCLDKEFIAEAIAAAKAFRDSRGVDR